MKILIDMNLPPAWVDLLTREGIQARHWSNVGDPRASDHVIMKWAREEGFIVFTHDLDLRTIGVSPMRISHVIKGDRPVTAELALLFGRAFNQTPQYWLNLQASYDLKVAKASIGKRLAGIHALAHA